LPGRSQPEFAGAAVSTGAGGKGQMIKGRYFSSASSFSKRKQDHGDERRGDGGQLIPIEGLLRMRHD
jgi:hypothetical protein